jgi:hypothetical protein
MDPRDDDIEISFFDDEPPTTEASSSRVRLPRRGGSGTGGAPRRPSGPSRGMTPILRLGAVVVVAVVVLVFFGLLIQSCASTSKHTAYSNYMNRVRVLAASSQSDGQQVASALTTPGLKVATLADKLDAIANQERQNVAAAQKLAAPGRLRPQNTQLVEALQLRVNGTQHLADTFRATATSKSGDDSSLLLQQANRLLASDVVYDDLFRGPARATMQQQGVLGVTVPESHYVTSPDETTKTYWSYVLQRLRGTTSSGGSSSGSTSSSNAIHGTNIESTQAEPGGKTLASDTLNTVTASPNLAFVVTVHNGGTAQEVRIAVTLTIQKSPKSIVKTQTIASINPDQNVPVRFPIAEEVPFGLTSHIKVDVATVPHEKDASNNTATYPVVFSLGG